MTTEEKTRFDELCEQIRITYPKDPDKMHVPAKLRRIGYVVTYPDNILGDVDLSSECLDDWHKQQAVGIRLSVAYKGRSYAFDYWLGVGHFECVNPHNPRYGGTEGIFILRLKPDAITPGSLMWSLLVDQYTADEDFAEFCAEFGYDTDSRRAERIYRAVQEQARQMRHLLGDDLPTFLIALEEQDRY